MGRPLDVRYESYVDHSPMGVSWSHGAERIVREFPFPIVAAGSERRDTGHHHDPHPGHDRRGGVGAAAR